MPAVAYRLRVVGGHRGRVPADSRDVLLVSGGRDRAQRIDVAGVGTADHRHSRSIVSPDGVSVSAAGRPVVPDEGSIRSRARAASCRRLWQPYGRITARRRPGSLRAGVPRAGRCRATLKGHAGTGALPRDMRRSALLTSSPLTAGRLLPGPAWCGAAGTAGSWIPAAGRVADGGLAEPGEPGQGGLGAGPGLVPAEGASSRLSARAAAERPLVPVMPVMGGACQRNGA